MPHSLLLATKVCAQKMEFWFGPFPENKRSHEDLDSDSDSRKKLKSESSQKSKLESSHAMVLFMVVFEEGTSPESIVLLPNALDTIINKKVLDETTILFYRIPTDFKECKLRDIINRARQGDNDWALFLHDYIVTNQPPNLVVPDSHHISTHTGHHLECNINEFFMVWMTQPVSVVPAKV
jgi:hypothetical protein